MYETRYDAEGAREARRALERYYPKGVISLLAANGTKIVPLGTKMTYAQASPALHRLSVNVDGWPVPPAGLFVVEERAVYLRSTSPMTVAHESAHALDCALGGGAYLSGQDVRIRKAFSDARGFVTPYAASGLDEYFAECVRAWVEANDARSPWPAATRERLQRVDPAMFEIVGGIFAKFRAGEQITFALEAI